jgi:hypothetical protein
MKRFLYIIALSLACVNTFGQKLPDVQPSGLLAPSNVRIDGKAAEWNENFGAENRRTDIFYTVANDDKNFYLLIKSASSASANKMMLGGVTFTINTQGKKREKDAFSVTYPLVVRGNRNRGAGGGPGQNRPFGGGQGGMQNRAQQSQEQRDSAALVARKVSLATVKEIKIAGFKSIADSLVSIYNEYGLKAVASFDAKGAMIYELAIPLSLMEISAADAKEFVYQIKVNGMSGGFGGGGFVGRPNGGGNFGGQGGGGNPNSAVDLMSPTDFWGKYTLLKK